MVDTNTAGSEVDEARNDAIIDALWHAHREAREADEFMPYHALLTAEDPDLAAPFLSHLSEQNQLWLSLDAAELVVYRPRIGDFT